MVLSAVQRWRSRQRRAAVALWYHPEQGELGIGGPNDQFGGVEPRRGDAVAGSLVREGLVEAKTFRRAQQVSLSDLALFHSWSYIDACTQPEYLARIFGVQPEQVDAEAVLRNARIGVGATVEASQEVAAGRSRVAFHFGGGYHHAEPEQGSGFCVFNDIGVAIKKLRADGQSEAIAIVDLDIHQGNGNSVAFGPREDTRIYSVHGSRWSHTDAPHHREIHLEGRVDDRRYLACLKTTLTGWLRDLEPWIIFYVAGADVLRGDVLGDFDLSLRAAFVRDKLVYDLVEELNAGLVVTMGGGYSKEAWLQYANFARFALTGRTQIVNSLDEGLRRSFDEVSSQLSPFELQAEPDSLDFGMTPEELFGQLETKPKLHRLLNYYSRAGVQVALERYGIAEAIRARGFSNLETELEVSDPTRQVLRITGARHDRRHLLVEIVLRKAHVAFDGAERPMLFVEWMLLQDPTRDFSLVRPPLPGQEHPGLGVSRYFVLLLLKVCERLGLDGIASRPSRYHNAAGAPSTFFFADPILQGRFEAMRHAVQGMSVSEASAAIEEGRLRTEDDEAVGWTPGLFVVPAHARMDDFRSERYDEARRDARRRLQDRRLRVSSRSSSSVSKT
ncbi:MAG: hypothetical protein AAF627_10720 [Myxococcota bacterium]